MDIFNKTKINELSSLINEKEDEIINLKKAVAELQKELNIEEKKVLSLLKKKDDLSKEYQIIQSINLELSSDLHALKKDIEISIEKQKEDIDILTRSYEEKLINQNDDFKLNLHTAKLTKCKELPLRIEEDLQKIISEKEIGFPWLATAISEYYKNLDNIYASYLERKKRPAFKEAAKIKEVAKEKALFKKEYFIMKYTIKYYESLFPWLSEYVGINSDELIEVLHSEKTSEKNEDPVLNYIQRGEYAKLNATERNQKALDRYWSSTKTPWQIGRDYERYIGYLYEKEGYRVQYFGIEKGLEDLGRDLVCTKDNITEVIQCKYWSKNKNIPIRENHINQLFGTTVKHYMDFSVNKQNNLHYFLEDYYKGKIVGTMVTSTILSDTAIEFSKTLNIKVKQEIELDFEYPCIKCNINPTTKERIYHLPFDQQYDKTKIDFNSGEFYAKTVREAEQKGFRRAYRWMGE
ncbi:Restriction endonuclease [Arenibacter nanhaiticus]|uniref:Restriction endonuclease n=1 Tax=Arenibacter nanhaiticus TaxID=558155 RepID=A0A1M6L8C5_9FLAO|nr:restriction endonuclease [Arenibacter nanhaiticus]SHJ67433.1 Restriction endonuclease [Arenibacter nanhaiticus]